MTVGIIWAIIPAAAALILLMALEAVLVSNIYLRKLAKANEMEKEIHLKLLDAYYSAAKELEEQLEGKDEMNEDLRRSINALNTDVEKYTEHEEKSRIEKKRLEKSLAELGKQQKKTEESAKLHNARLGDTEKALKDANEKIESLEKEAKLAEKKSSEKVAALEKQIEALKETIAVLRSADKLTDNKDADGEKEPKGSQKKKSELEREYDELSSFTSYLKRQITETIEELNMVKDSTSREAMSEVIQEKIDVLNAALNQGKEDKN